MGRYVCLLIAVSLAGFAAAQADDSLQRPVRQMTEEEHQQFVEQMDADREAAIEFQRLVQEGKAHAKDGDKERAIASYRTAIEADPKNALVLYYEIQISELKGLGDSHRQHLQGMLERYSQADFLSSSNCTSF